MKELADYSTFALQTELIPKQRQSKDIIITLRGPLHNQDGYTEISLIQMLYIKENRLTVTAIMI